MAETTLAPGKWSSEFFLSLGGIVAFTILVLFDKITLTPAMMETVFQLLMVYVAGRAIPKTAEQLKNIGGAKTLQKLNVQLLDVIQAEQAKR